MITVDFGRLSLRPGDRVLDIGCGSGRHTAAAYQCPNINVFGVDLNLDDVQQARNRLLFTTIAGSMAVEAGYFLFRTLIVFRLKMPVLIL